MSEHITRCPECGTSFRISESHLNAGKGAVRCGSCLHIFSARENLVQQHAPEPQIEEPDLEEESEDEEDVLISDTMEMDAARANSVVSSAEVGDEFSEEFNDTFADTLREKSATGEHEFNLFERDDNLAESDDDDVSQDESWALDLLNDDDDEEEKESEQEHDDRSEDEYTKSDEQLERDMEGELADEGTYYANSADTSSEYDNPFQIIDEEPDHLEEYSEKSPLERYNKYDSVELEDPEEDDNEQTYAQPIHSTGSYPAANYSTGTDYLSAIEPEPVEFDYHANSNFWNSKAFWGGLSVAASLLLAIQAAWIKFPTLSTVEPYRAYYAKACDVIGCQLPNLIDRSKIRSTNLVVRSHPHVRGALVVDAVIQNTAKFEQSFPTMDLIFTDARDNVVAARRLQPNDYLGGELAGRSTMPIKQPIHIALEISDPGESATGYRIIIAN